MTGARPGRAWGLIAAQAASHGGRVSAGDVCAAVLAAAGVTGAWLSAASAGEAGHLMRVTDGVSEQLAELALTLGEGPSLDASASGGPALASDLGGEESGRRWPRVARRGPGDRLRRWVRPDQPRAYDEPPTVGQGAGGSRPALVQDHSIHDERPPLTTDLVGHENHSPG